MNNIKLIEDLLEQATPGPWFHDWGNWDIESHHPDHHRTEICKQPDELKTNVHTDFELICALRNQAPDIIKELVILRELAVAAKDILGLIRYEQPVSYSIYVSLKNAFARLESYDRTNLPTG